MTSLLRWTDTKLTEVLNAEFLVPRAEAKLTDCQEEKSLWEVPARNRFSGIKRDFMGIF